jgi:hypothetical protein
MAGWLRAAYRNNRRAAYNAVSTAASGSMPARLTALLRFPAIR